MTLPPRDPVLLFGEEALQDPKLLRKAYARLLRTWGPETNPQGFVILQAAYEEAQARAAAPTPSPDAAAEADEAGTAEWSDTEWSTWLRQSERSLEELRAELDRHPGEAAGAVLGLAVDGALAPDGVRAALVNLLLRDGAGRLSYSAARIAFALDPALPMEGWPSLMQELRGTSRRTPLEVARLDALLEAHETQAAWSFWQETGRQLMSELPDVVLSRYETLLGMAAWVVPENELLAEREWLQDVHLKLDDVTRERFDRIVLVDLAVRRSVADSSVNPAVARAVLEAYGSRGSTRAEGVMVAFWRFVRAVPNPEVVLDGLAPSHPMLVAAFDRLLMQVSGRLAFYEGKSFAEADWFELREGLLEVEAELHRRQRELRARLEDIHEARLAEHRRRAMGWALSTLVLGIGAPWFPLLAPFVVVTLGMATMAWVDTPAPPEAGPAPSLSPEDLGWARAQIEALQTREGAWLHELALLAEEGRLEHVGTIVDTCFRRRWHDLLVLGPIHFQRGCHPRGIAA